MVNWCSTYLTGGKRDDTQTVDVVLGGGIYRTAWHESLGSYIYRVGGSVMMFCVRVAWPGKDTVERYRRFIVKSEGWSSAIVAAHDRLRRGERIINVSEGGYQ